MCILFIAVNYHPNYPLIIAANRDEFHARETQSSHFWRNEPNVLAGKDLVGGGTWMGMNRNGRLSALTNIRAPGKERADAITRGKLVFDFIQTNVTPQNYLEALSANRQDYNGYNLLFGSVNKLQVYNSFENTSYQLEDGVYGLSNASLNSPWPKLDMGRSALANYCHNADVLNNEHLFELLANNQPAKDEDLPQTGIPIDWEKKLSSIFIQSPEYGTRSSTILLLDKQDNIYWEERTFNELAERTSAQIYEFKLQQSLTKEEIDKNGSQTLV